MDGNQRRNKSKGKFAYMRNLTKLWGYSDVYYDYKAKLYRDALKKFYISIELLADEFLTCCQLNCVNRLAIVYEILTEEYSIALDDVQLEAFPFESPLMLAISSESYEVVDFLLSKADKKLVEKQCTNSRYLGVSAVHLAVMSGKLSLVSRLLAFFESAAEKKDHFMKPVGGTHFKKWSLTCLAPLLALDCGHLDIYCYLVDLGADLDVVDPVSGFSALHVLVKFGKCNPETAKEMMTKYFECHSMTAWFCRKHDIDIREYTVRDHYEMKYLLLKIENREGYTPLTYAARHGIKAILQDLLQYEGVYKHTLWRVGPNRCALYDMSEVDPFVANLVRPGKPSVLELLTHSSSDKVLSVLSNKPLKYLMEQRWRCYSPLLIIWMLFHISYMSWLSILTIQIYSYSEKNVTISSSDQTSPVFSFIVMAIISSLYSLLILCDIWKLFKQLILGRIFSGLSNHYKVPWKVAFRFDEYDLLLLVFSLSTLAWVSNHWLVARQQPEQILLLCLSLICGWLFCLHFTRAFESTCCLTIMLQQIFLTDLARFAIVVGILLCGFAISLLVLFASGNEPPPPEWATPQTIMAELFELMIGMTDMGFILLAPHQYQLEVTVLIYMFIIMTTILMLNMLIAAMSNTYMKIANKDNNLCNKLKLKLMLSMEQRMLPCLVRQFMASRIMIENEGKNTWDLPVKEHYIKDKHLH